MEKSAKEELNTRSFMKCNLIYIEFKTFSSIYFSWKLPFEDFKNI